MKRRDQRLGDSSHVPVRILLARAVEVACAVAGQAEIVRIERLLSSEDKRRTKAA